MPGKPKGMPKTGGRVKGTKNRTTLAREQAIRDSGLTPLDFFLNILRDDKNDMPLRLDAAKSAAPYIHPRLAAIEHSGKDGGPVQVVLSGADEGLL